MKPYLLSGINRSKSFTARPLPAARQREIRYGPIVLLLLLAFALFAGPAGAADGDLDLTFRSGTNQPQGRLIRGKVDYPDGKFLIYGFFTTTGQLRNSIARMNADGTTDTSFYTANLSGEVRSAYLLGNGQIYIAGNFTITAGSYPYNILAQNFARLNADGTLDTAFPKVFNQSGAVNEMAVQTDGKILLGGYSLSLIESPANTYHLLRLNSDGTLDGAYANRSAAGGYVSAVKLLAGDGARVFGTLPRAGTGHVDYWLDLNSSGVVQTNIGDETVDGPILSVGTQSIIPNNGKLVICGQFQQVLGAARNRVARFNTDMTLDTTFDVGVGPNGMVSDLIVQGNDKLVLAGNFDAFNGAAAGYLARLNPNGDQDGTFSAGAGANDRIVSLTPGPGGSGLMICGYFDDYNNNINFVCIAGLDDNGNLIKTYVAYVLANYRGTVYALTAQSDGKILVGGDFHGFNGKIKNPDGSYTTPFKYCGGLARLNPDGSLDTSFKGGVDGYVDSIAVQPDGKILLAGKFGAIKGYARTSLARLNPDGSLDTTFNPLVVKGDGSVSDLRQVALLSGGQLMAAGDFAQVNGANRNLAARLNGNGSLDAAFNAQPNISEGSNYVGYRVAAVGSNYVVSGSLSLNGTSRGFLARFTNSGALDPTFGPTAPPTPAANVNILSSGYTALPLADMAIQPDGKILVSGGFTEIIDGSGSPPARNQIARFSAGGLLDNSFIPVLLGSNVAALALQPNGKILAGTVTFYNGTLARLNPDGSQDPTFSLGTWWTSYTHAVYAILRQATGKAIVGGYIWVYYSPSGFSTSLPRVIAGPPNYDAGGILLLLGD